MTLVFLIWKLSRKETDANLKIKSSNFHVSSKPVFSLALAQAVTLMSYPKSHSQ